MNIRFVFSFILVLVLAPVVESQGQIDTSNHSRPVRIALLDKPIGAQSTVRVGDLVELSGGNNRTRNEIARLDLAIKPGTARDAKVSKAEIMARILLAGIEPDEFEIISKQPTSQTVNSENQSSSSNPEDAIANAIRRHVSRGLNVDEGSVLVALDLLSTQLSQISSDQITHLSFRPLEHADRLVGRNRVVIGVFENDQLKARLSIPAVVSVYKSVLVTNRPIDRGELIDESNTHVETSEFLNSSAIPVSPSEILGRQAKRNIRAQQILKSRDVQLATYSENVINARDIVSVEATKSGLRITMSGVEALRAGKVGDVIPLRNPTSNEKLFGRIKSKDLVELIY